MIASHLPPSFRSNPASGWINVLGVAFALSAATMASLATIGFPIAWFAGVPVFAAGALWASTFRIRWAPKLSESRTLAVGWIVATPLALLAAMASGAALLSREDPYTQGIGIVPTQYTGVGALVGAFVAATFGAALWIPGLVASCICFGLPLDARRKANGLASQERAERRIAMVCIALSCAAIGLSFAADPEKTYLVSELLSLAARQAPEAKWGVAATFTEAVGALGVLVGLIAAALTSVRMRRRSEFVRRVETGAIPGLRIGATAAKKTLVRVSTETGGAYRALEREEELCTIDSDSSSWLG